jgi:hypothetical protein
MGLSFIFKHIFIFSHKSQNQKEQKSSFKVKMVFISQKQAHENKMG